MFVGALRALHAPSQNQMNGKNTTQKNNKNCNNICRKVGLQWLIGIKPSTRLKLINLLFGRQKVQEHFCLFRKVESIFSKLYTFHSALLSGDGCSFNGKTTIWFLFTHDGYEIYGFMNRNVDFTLCVCVYGFVSAQTLNFIFCLIFVFFNKIL
jgi:hypothetical protein